MSGSGLGAGPGRLVSVNVGKVTEMVWRDQVFQTAIGKRPVEGRRAVGRLGIEGDQQGDVAVHGGPDKAIYGYASEHHAFWTEVLGKPVGPGSFGENLTLAGVPDEELSIGDRLRVGTALLEVSQPRQPCNTFGAFHQRRDLPKRFTEAGWPGAYFRVIEEGWVEAGDAVERVSRGDGRWTITRVFGMIMGRDPLAPDLDDLLAHPALAERSRMSLVRRRGAAG